MFASPMASEVKIPSPFCMSRYHIQLYQPSSISTCALDKQILDMIMNREDGLEMFSVPVFPTGFSFAPVADPAQPNSAIVEAGGL
jgi:hypothetical protein